ncbi:MAG: peptidoglycan-binding domain-containing protein [Amylibacter sp.]
MSEFVWLKRGDKLPAAAIAQMLINRTGASLTVDGDYGSATKAAVKQFQSAHSLSSDGVIGRNTWSSLVHQETLPICDSVDVFDPDLITSEQRFLTNVGGNPIITGGMSNGTEQVIMSITARHSQLFMARFHGHGNKGVAGASFGHGATPGAWSSRAAFVDDASTRSLMSRLGRSMGPYGCIQFMHCQTGGGRDGRQFLQMVADAAGVPATAAIHDQYASTLKETVRYEGATRTCCPSGVSIRNWAMRLPEFTGMSF